MRRVLTALLALAASAAPAAAQSLEAAPGRFQVLHNAPDPELARVDVYVNGVRLPGLDDLGFREGTPPVVVSPGTAVTVVVAADTSSGIEGALALGAFVAESGEDYYAVVEGLRWPYDFADSPDGRRAFLNVRVFRAGASFGLDTGDGVAQSAVALHHGSPDLGPYHYDLYTNSGSGLVNFGLGFGGVFRGVVFPTGDLNYRLRLPDVPEFVIGGGLGVPAGEDALVFLSGFDRPAANQNGPGLGLFVLYESGEVRRLWTPEAETPAEAAPASSGPAVAVYPNPVRGAATLIIGGADPLAATVEVLDVQGRTVRQERAVLGAGRTHRLDASALPAGVYTVRVTAEADGAVSHVPFTVVR